jgi:hypothetical protein
MMTILISNSTLLLSLSRAMSCVDAVDSRKARMGFPSVGIGKSGGARVIYLHVPEHETNYLVHIYGKSRKSNLTKAEQNTLRQIAHEIRNLGRP